MIILDANGLIHCLDNDKVLPDEHLLVTDDLRDEYETALLINGQQELKLKDVSELPGYDEAFYLKKYAHYLNTYSVDLSSMRGITDASILALVSCVLNGFGGAQQIQLDLGDVEDIRLMVISNDDNLIRRLTRDFRDKVTIIDPETL